MTVDVTLADERDLDRWNRRVERARYGSVFHQQEALAVLADCAGATLHPLVGRKGEEVVGLFPVFELRKGPIPVATSPPPDLRVPYLGPALLNMDKLTRRKAERRQRRFVDGCFEWLRGTVSPWYLHVRTSPGYADLRPFKYNDCGVTPSYTYLVELTDDREELLMRFSSDARSNIRDGRAADVDVGERDPAAIDRIVEQVRRRYENQGVSYSVTPEFVRTLADELPDGAVRPYTCRVDGEFVGGIVVLEHGDTVYRWQGGVKTDLDVDVQVNDVLDWQVMDDAIDRGLARYDLVGASNPRINRYKAKFGPDLAPFYSVEGGSRPARIAASFVQRVRKT